MNTGIADSRVNEIDLKYARPLPDEVLKFGRTYEFHIDIWRTKQIPLRIPEIFGKSVSERLAIRLKSYT